MWVLCLKSWQLRKRADEQKRIKKKSLQKTSKVETLSARPFMRLFKIWMTITKPIHKKSKSFLRVFSWLLHSLTCSSRSAVWLSLTNWCSGPSINQPIKKPHWVITSQTVWAKTEERDTQSEGCRLPLPCRKENKTWGKERWGGGGRLEENSYWFNLLSSLSCNDPAASHSSISSVMNIDRPLITALCIKQQIMFIHPAQW